MLPGWLQVIAYALPSTYAFEGMRATLRTGSFDMMSVATAFALNLVYLVVGAAFFSWMFRQVREKGYLSRLGME